ncbi:MAG: SpoIIE family protein phosphatase [bacterium]|nr:SpoIIE family protein phosphatase [bacterium]
MILNRRKELIKLIETIPVFKGFDKSDFKLITPLLVPIVYPPESLIIKQGEEGDSMYIIKKGSVKISRIEGKDMVSLGNLERGSYFGELSLIDELPRSADVESCGQVEVFRLSRHDFEKLLEKELKIANIFYRNCLNETFTRFRHAISNFTFSQHVLKEKSARLQVIDEDLSHARTIQSYLIDTKGLDGEESLLKNIRQSYIYEPCIAVGGDFLNILKLDEERVGIIIADVEGHGITASLGTGVLKSAVSIIISQLGDKPTKFMRYLNKHFANVISRLYATCYYALIDKKQNIISMAKAGHHHPLFWKKEINDFIEIQSMGSPLGLVKEAKYSQVELEIEEGDKILFFTDGIIEQNNTNSIAYSEKRLREKFSEYINKGEKNIVESIYNDLKEFTEGIEFADDITLLLIEL